MRIVFVTEQEQEQVKLIESLSLAKLSLFLTASRISTKPTTTNSTTQPEQLFTATQGKKIKRSASQ